MEAQTTWTALRHSLKINYWSDQKQCWVKKGWIQVINATPMFSFNF